MGEKDIQRLMDLAKRKLNEKRTKKQALDTLISAGILTEKGNYTKPYQHLARVIKKYPCTIQGRASSLDFTDVKPPPAMPFWKILT